VTVVESRQDPEALTLTIVAELAAPPERVWQVWSDPRQLERWWGPPTWPATFTQHELTVGSFSRWHMTGPSGEESHGWWRIVAVDEPRSLEYEDGFARGDGSPEEGRPVMLGHVELEEVSGGTRMTVRTRFATLADMQELADMGMAEGMTLAMGQLDDVLLTSV
jgi:uncharacterized protein YndB with AHSA1/START domain